jgi:hypothetical protein
MRPSSTSASAKVRSTVMPRARLSPKERANSSRYVARPRANMTGMTTTIERIGSIP